MIDHLLTALAPHLTEILTAILIGIFGLIAAAVRRMIDGIGPRIGQLLGLQAERIWREALHSALESGAERMLLSTLDTDARVEAVVDYARRSVPEAIANLSPGPGVLADLARAKLAAIRGDA